MNLLHMKSLPNPLGHKGLDNNFVCKRFPVQTLLWSLEFVIQIDLEHTPAQFETWLKVEVFQQIIICFS